MIATLSYQDQSPEVKARFDRIKARPPLLQISGLYKRFHSKAGEVVALKDINLTVHRREFMCVLGQSGCGKSTLIRILAGLETPSEGQVLVDGQPVTGPGRDRGMVFQSYTLFPWLTVKQNVMFGPRMAGKSGLTNEGEARQWLALVGLDKFEDSYPHQLSGGMKQRAAIARALANEPRILLMDEPFGALDPQTRQQMQAYLLQIWKNVDITIFFITHDLDEAIFLSDRILVLDPRPGRVREIVEVPVPRPRDHEQLRSAEFLATKQHLETIIHPEDSHAKPQFDKLPVMRMTTVGDDVE
ncbi:NitT/TauT family transport system ATP-binding protein [Prosthecobacter fusiformis]|uniref:NitT/TauT family transport system ATP-binding protein n=1 Tax=Prosthecobacter fusiformis TaxID=48464 RepID=A0A4R7RPD4_9BACT|nr:ABC transporter ATP-binding protein [Prosthecobacter fusiformis]TDU67321.1 NitT/TauT family transport system ATP-binding protein [Prosthecobacter fusiformis]